MDLYPPLVVRLKLGKLLPGYNSRGFWVSIWKWNCVCRDMRLVLLLDPLPNSRASSLENNGLALLLSDLLLLDPELLQLNEG